MKCVYVLMYKKDGAMTPYAVFENSVTAEQMKREGDEIVKVPYFEDKKNNSNLYTTSPNSIQVVPCNDHTTSVTYFQDIDQWGRESTTAPPYNTYPRVTCQKTVDEHKWTNRSD